MIVLGSKSPRRRELLEHLIGADRVHVLPPDTANEASFDDVHHVAEIAERASEIAATKNHDVCEQLITEDQFDTIEAVLTVDTVIVAQEHSGQMIALGKPPDDDSWPETVHFWFHNYLLRETHLVISAVCITTPADDRRERTVMTEVTFRGGASRWVEHYIRTGEPRGKAGGYGLQGAGSLFVERIHGSPSNVIGLPLLETAEMLEVLGLLDPSAS